MLFIEALRALPQEARYVRVDVADGMARLTASLPEGQISAQFEGEEPEGSYAVDGKVVRLARALAPEASAKRRGERLRLEAAGGSYAFSTLAADTVPVLAEPERWDPVAVDPAKFRQALTYVGEAAATQDLRYYLNAVFVRFDTDRYEAVASNGHVAAIAAGDGAHCSGKAQIILPRKCVAEIVRLLDEGAKVEFGRKSSRDTMLRVSSRGLAYLGLGFDAVYPDYARIFEGNQPSSSASFEANAFAAALTRLQFTADAKTPVLRLAFESASLRMTCADDAGKDGAETLAAVQSSFDGQFECGLNPHYGAAAVAAALECAKNVSLGWVSAEKAITISPVMAEGAAASEIRKWIVAPLRT